MPDNGYGAGLFNPQGPKDFATAVGGIAGSLKEVVAGFTTFGTQATDVIGTLEAKINKLCQEMAACKDSLAQGWNVPSSATAGATVGGSAQQGAQGAQSGQGQPSTNQAGITPGAQWGSPPPGPGGGGTGSAPGSGVPQGTAGNGPGQFPGQGPASPGGPGNFNYPPGANTPPALPAAGGGGGGGGGGAAAQAILPTAAKGLQGLLSGGLATAALQGNVVANMASNWGANGGQARGMEVMNGNMWAVSPQDYIQANYLAMSQSGATPGSAGWRQLQGDVRAGQALSGGALNATQATQARLSQFSGTNTRTQLAFGIQMSPGGKQMSSTADFDKIINLVFRGGTPSADVMAEAFRPSNQMDIAAQQMLGAQPGDPLYIEFQNYAMTKAGRAAKGQTSPMDLTTTKGIQKAGMWNQGMAQLKATSAAAQVKSNALPAISDVNTHLDNLSGVISKWINLVAGPAGKGAPSAINSALGSLPVVGSASQVGLGLAKKIPGLGNVLTHLGFQSGGLVPGYGSEDSVPAMLTPGEFVLPRGTVQGSGAHAQLASPGGQTASSSIADLMVSKLSDLQPNTVADLLFSPPGAKTLIGQLTAKPAQQRDQPGSGQTGGAAAGGGGAGGTGSPAAAGMQSAYAWSGGSGTSTPMDLSSKFGASGGSGGTGSSGSASTTGSSAGAGSSGSAPAGNLAAWISKAMQVAGVSGTDWTKGLNTIIQHESSGNPKAINRTDSNAQAGHPSQGLMQEIPSTFQAYAMAGYNKDITDPVSNIIAGIKYIESRYKSIDNVPGIVAVSQGKPYVGYARGSQNIDRTQLALLHRGEAVIPAADNYTSGPVYNRGGASASGAPIIHLDFKSGSIQLVVPANSSQEDMDRVAKQFVKAVSKPQVLTSVRSS